MTFSCGHIPERNLHRFRAIFLLLLHYYDDISKKNVFWPFTLTFDLWPWTSNLPYISLQLTYSAGQMFRIFNAMNFLLPPWERGLTLNMEEYETINSLTVAFYLEEISSLLEEQCWIQWRARMTTKTALFSIFSDQCIWGNIFKI